jgi:hypothetical protein
MVSDKSRPPGEDIGNSIRARPAGDQDVSNPLV